MEETLTTYYANVLIPGEDPRRYDLPDLAMADSWAKELTARHEGSTIEFIKTTRRIIAAYKHGYRVQS